MGKVHASEMEEDGNTIWATSFTEMAGLTTQRRRCYWVRFWEWMTRVAMLFARPRSEALASSTSFICTCMAPLCRLLFSGRGRRAGTARPVAELQSPAKFEFGMVAYFRKHVTSHTNFAHVALQKRVSVERSYGRWD